MTLSQEHTALFSLLRAGLWEREPDDLSPFPLSDEQWRAVFKMAASQTVSGIVCRGVGRLPEDLMPSDLQMMQWAAVEDNLERKNLKMNGAVRGLMAFLQSHGLHPVLLKGQGVAQFYEEPLLRECGDIDLYFNQDEFETAAALMRGTGCTLRKEADGSYCYSWQGVPIEHHTHIYDICTPRARRCLTTLAERHGCSEFSVAAAPEGETAVVKIPAPLPNLLLLSTHLLKHLIGAGVGLRQFCDIARAYHSLKGQFSAEELETTCRRSGFYRWTLQLHAFLKEYIGIPESDLPFFDRNVQTSPKMLQIVLEGGNFGQHGEFERKAEHSGLRRKLLTFRSFWKHSGFSLKYAPKEAFWTPLNLLAGNIIK